LINGQHSSLVGQFKNPLYHINDDGILSATKRLLVTERFKQTSMLVAHMAKTAIKESQ
jgi:hypothetical protein